MRLLTEVDVKNINKRKEVLPSGKEGDVTYYEFDSEKSSKQPTGYMRFPIKLTHDEEEIFKNPKFNLPKLSEIPKEVVSIHAYTLDKNPASPYKFAEAIGVLDAIKSRNMHHKMTDADIDKICSSAVAKIMKDGSSTANLIMREYYKSFFENAKIDSDIVFVTLGSTSGLVQKFGRQIKDQLGVRDNRFITDAFRKTGTPGLSKRINGKTEGNVRVSADNLANILKQMRANKSKYNGLISDNISTAISNVIDQQMIINYAITTLFDTYDKLVIKLNDAQSYVPKLVSSPSKKIRHL